MTDLLGKLRGLARRITTVGVFRPKTDRRRVMLNVMLLALAAAAIVILPVWLVTTPTGAAGDQSETRLMGLAIVGSLAAAVILYAINRFVSGDLASSLLVLFLITVATVSDTPDEVANGRGLLVYAIPILAASVLLRPWASFVAAAISSLVVIGIGIVILQEPVPNLPAVIGFFMVALVSWLSASNLERALDRLRTANEALRESEEKYRRRFEHVSDVIFSIDQEFVLRDVSPSVEGMLGYAPEDLIGKELQELDVLAPESLEQALSDLRYVLEGEQGPSSVYHLIARDGSSRWADVGGSPLIREGEVVGIVAVARDVTERREIEEQLRQQERLAAVGQLAGGIAHDFNNILAAIILYAQIPLRKAEPSNLTEKTLETILEEARRAADLVQQILDFSRSAMMETEPVDLSSLVLETATLLRRTIPENVRVITEVETHGCLVEADPTRIHQLLMNLAVNADDAMPEGGDLRIRVDRLTVDPDDPLPVPDMPPGRWAALSVSDTGTGMTDEVQDHLFEPFFTTKKEGNGTGLGLAQVYGITKQHHGFIDVDTVEGEGSTFTVFLPLLEHAQPEAAAEANAPASPGRGETIMVVEDAERLRGAIEAGLKALGYDVITAATGREALEILPLQDVDLVLTDVVMPETGGVTVLQRVRASDPDLKVIAMTGHVVGTDLDHLMDRGFSEVLSKPFTIQELTRTVREVLDT